MMTATTARTTSTGIAYDDRGTGTTALLFLPGWCGPRTLFAPLTTRLPDSCRSIAVDWRGHGDSAPASGDFGLAELVDDAISVIDDSRVERVIPVTVAHAGWVAVELRRRLGAARVPSLVILDWMVLGAPEPFLGAVTAMEDPSQTRMVVDQISGMWRAGLDLPDLDAYVAAMVEFPDEMWARAAREIARAFGRDPVPLAALAELESPPTTVHLYAQPADPAFLEAQREFAAVHPWFSVERLDASSHFPMFEVPGVIAERLAEVSGSAG